jgi:hypothetical protein
MRGVDIVDALAHLGADVKALRARQAEPKTAGRGELDRDARPAASDPAALQRQDHEESTP